MHQLRGPSRELSYWVGPQAGRKVFTLQTLPGLEEPFSGSAGRTGGFSLHAGVAARANQRDKPKRLCRYITRSAVYQKRLSLTKHGDIRYELKRPCRVCAGAVRIVACIGDPVVIKKDLVHLQEKLPARAALLLPDSRAPTQSGPFGWRKEAFPCNQCCCIAQRQQGLDWSGGGSRLQKGQMTGIRSGQDSPFVQDFGMTRLESSGSDCPMGMRFWGKGVNTSYARACRAGL